MLPDTLEEHLKEMGVLDYQPVEVKPEKIVYDMTFKDPRDPITGEVPF